MQKVKESIFYGHSCSLQTKRSAFVERKCMQSFVQIELYCKCILVPKNKFLTEAYAVKH